MNAEYLVFLAIASVIIVCFVCCFIRNPALRFFMGLVLFVASAFGLLVLEGRVAESDAIRRSEGNHVEFMNRQRLIKENTEGYPPASSAPAVVSAVPPSAPRVAPRATPSIADIERQYGAKPAPR